MVQQIQFTSAIPERGIDRFEGYYSIESGNVHIFIPAKLDIPSMIDHLDCFELTKEIHCQFMHCSLYRVGRDFDEFIPETALIGESIIPFKANAYKEVRFQLSNDILSFLEPPWKFLTGTTDKEITQIKFLSNQERKRIIPVNEDLQFVLHTGYASSDAHSRYTIDASALFAFVFAKPVTRETAYNLVQSVADFYSLFFTMPIKTKLVQLVNNDDILVGYHGALVNEETKESYFGNRLIGELNVKDHLDHLPAWINQYTKVQIPSKLLRDASKLSDEQLRFICYMRSLEVFHKENFVTTSKPPLSFYRELHSFVTGAGMSDVGLPKFTTPEIRLNHRIFDLIRFVHDLMTKDRLLFGCFTMLNRAQEFVDTRNYLIHFSDSKKKLAIADDQLGYRNFQLSLLIRIVFLRYFGFKDENINMLIGAAGRRFFGN